MPGVYNAISIFVLEPITPEGYEVWGSCRCGASLEQWVTSVDAEADLLLSALLAFEKTVS